MKSKSRFQISLFLCGSFFLITSILHCLQHWIFNLGQPMGAGDPNMIYLYNWSVALLLCFMASITLIAAKSKTVTLKQMKMLSWILMVVWSCRLVLEILYPVNFRFIIFDQPSLVLKIGIMCLLSILMFPFITFQKRMAN